MKILFLTSKFPYPLDQGDKLRAYWQMKLLSRFHEIHLCALSRGRVPESHLAGLPFCAGIRSVPYHIGDISAGLLRSGLSEIPFQAGYFCSFRIRRRIRTILEQIRPDLIICQLIRMAPLVENGSIPIALDYMDALSERILQKGNYPMIPSFLLAMEHRKTRIYERRLLERCASFFITTERDRRNIDPGDSSPIFVSGNGVDLDAWMPRTGECDYDLLFAGNMSYGPNISAAETLAREILPLVHERIPRARVLLAGMSPGRRVRNLRSDRIHVSGYVKSMPEAYARARIFVAPMRAGTGIQNKVLQALAMGKPCVISPIVAGGFDDSIRRVAMLADSPPAFARACVDLLADPAKRSEYSEKGRAFVRRHHSWETICSELNRILEDRHSPAVPAAAE